MQSDQNNDALAFFHDEILAFARWVSPNKAEIAWRNQIVDRLARSVRSLWPSANVQIYGSTESGLSVPSSDIDVVIERSNAPDGELKFHMLADQLESDGVVLGRPIIAGSNRVPVMKMIDAESGCLVDVSFEGHAGPANTRLVMSFLDAYPLARPLALVIKYYLKQKKLNDTYLGGIGSYTLALLVISYLQQYGNSADLSLPLLLCGFFELYGTKFDYTNNAVSVLNGGAYITKGEKGWINPEFEEALAVEDPLVPEIDVGAASFNIRDVKAAFADGWDILCRGPVHLSHVAPHHGGPSRDFTMSFLRRLINVTSAEIARRKHIRDTYNASLVARVPPTGASRQAPRASSTGARPTSISTPTDNIGVAEAPAKRRRKKPKKIRSDQPANDGTALAGAHSASAASISDGESNAMAEVSDASHASSRTGVGSSDDDCSDDYASFSDEIEHLDIASDTSALHPAVPHTNENKHPRRVSFSDIARFTAAAVPNPPAPQRTSVSDSPLVKDDTNFPSLGAALSKMNVKTGALTPVRSAISS